MLVSYQINIYAFIISKKTLIFFTLDGSKLPNTNLKQQIIPEEEECIEDYEYDYGMDC